MRKLASGLFTWKTEMELQMVKMAAEIKEFKDKMQVLEGIFAQESAELPQKEDEGNDSIKKIWFKLIRVCSSEFASQSYHETNGRSNTDTRR